VERGKWELGGKNVLCEMKGQRGGKVALKRRTIAKAKPDNRNKEDSFRNKGRTPLANVGERARPRGWDLLTTKEESKKKGQISIEESFLTVKGKKAVSFYSTGSPRGRRFIIYLVRGLRTAKRIRMDDL